jgi:hypothetical protein
VLRCQKGNLSEKIRYSVSAKLSVFLLATRTGLEPATTGSTVRDSNQLSYRASIDGPSVLCPNAAAGGPETIPNRAFSDKAVGDFRGIALEITRTGGGDPEHVP